MLQPKMVMVKPDLDLRVVVHPAQSESTYVTMSRLSLGLVCTVGLSVNSSSRVAWMYLTVCLSCLR